MNKTLLNFTATALLSTLLTHPCLAMVGGSKQRDGLSELESGSHTSIAIEDNGQASTFVAAGEQGDHNVFLDKRISRVGSQSSVRSLPNSQTNKLLVPKGNSGITYVVNENATGPKVQGYDFHKQQKTHLLPSRSLGSVVVEGDAQQPLLEGAEQSNVASSSHASVDKGSLEQLGLTPMGVQTVGQDNRAGDDSQGLAGYLGSGIVGYVLGAGMVGLAWLFWGGCDQNSGGDVKDVAKAGVPGFSGPGLNGLKPSLAPCQDAGSAGQDPSDSFKSDIQAPGVDEDLKCECSDTKADVPDNNSPLAGVGSPDDDSGDHPGSGGPDVNGTTSTTTPTTTSTTTTTTTAQPTTTTTKEPTTTTTTTKKPDTTNVPSIVTEPVSNHRPYDEVWVEYCEQNTDYVPLENEITYWQQHHQQQPTGVVSETLEACRAEYIGDFFYLYYPDNCVYAYDQVNQRSFFRCPSDLDWIRLSH